MAKEKSANPVAAHAKAEKARALKKSRANIQAQRAERLAHRNPERLQRQIDELKATKEAQGGSLRPRDAQQLEQLEREVAAIRKARASLPESQQQQPRERRPQREGNDARQRHHGDTRGAGNANHTSLGKRRRLGRESDSDDTDPEARDIPMPRDTPPPVPSRRYNSRGHDQQQQQQHKPHALPAKPAAAAQPAQTTYSSAPQIRNLTREAVSAFVPSAVAARLRQKQQSAAHGGRLLEPEELERLEAGGYADAARASEAAADEEAHRLMMQQAGAEDEGGGDGDVDLEAEEAAFARELAAAKDDDHDDAAATVRPRAVQVEEVEDAGD